MIHLDFTDTVTAIAWAIVAAGSAAGVVHRSCRTVVECVALGWISLSATGRAWAIFNNSYLEPPDILLALAAATYVVVHVRKAIQENKHDKRVGEKSSRCSK
jgi:hypothetical protein